MIMAGYLRMVPKGETAFRDLDLDTAGYSHFSSNKAPDNLEEILVSALKELEPEEYSSFCWQAHKYAEEWRDYYKSGDKKPPEVLNCIDEMPHPNEVPREAYDEYHRRRRNSERRWSNATALCGLAGFFAAAVGGGELMEYIEYTGPLAYAASAVCSVIGAGIGVLIPKKIGKKIGEKLVKEREEGIEQENQQYIDLVEQYIDSKAPDSAQNL